MRPFLPLAILLAFGCGGGGGKTPVPPPPPPPPGPSAVPRLLVKWPYLVRSVHLTNATRSIVMTVSSGTYSVTGSQDRLLEDRDRERIVAAAKPMRIGPVTLRLDLYSGLGGTSSLVGRLNMAATLGASGELTSESGEPIVAAPEKTYRNVTLQSPSYGFVGEPIQYAAVARDEAGAIVPMPPDWGRWSLGARGSITQSGLFMPTGSGSARVEWSVPREGLYLETAYIPIFPDGRIVPTAARTTPFSSLDGLQTDGNRVFHSSTGEYRPLGTYSPLVAPDRTLIGFDQGPARIRAFDILSETYTTLAQLPVGETIRTKPIALPNQAGFVLAVATESGTTLRAYDWQGRELDRVDVPSLAENVIRIGRAGRTIYLQSADYRFPAYRWTAEGFADLGYVTASVGSQPHLNGSNGSVAWIGNTFIGEDPNVALSTTTMVAYDTSMDGEGRAYSSNSSYYGGSVTFVDDYRLPDPQYLGVRNGAYGFGVNLAIVRLGGQEYLWNRGAAR